jgi:hypothetical protein
MARLVWQSFALSSCPSVTDFLTLDRLTIIRAIQADAVPLLTVTFLPWPDQIPQLVPMPDSDMKIFLFTYWPLFVVTRSLI